MFPFTTNAAIKNGDGMALAYRAGAPLKDMEFVQYHPTGLPFTGILITEAARAEGGYLINKDGYRYLQDYNLGTPQPQPVLRSDGAGPARPAVAGVHEGARRRAARSTRRTARSCTSICGISAQKKIDAKIPFVRELCMKYQNLDPVTDLIPVRPVVHYMMGGVHTDINGATPLPGLYAAGEVACVSINGANRLGSNSLPELLVFGARAGQRRGRVRLARSPTSIRASWRRRRTSERRLEHDLLHKTGAASASPTSATRCRRRWRRAPASTARARRWRRAPSSCAGCRSASRDVAIEDHSRTFNTERIAALELSFMLDVAEAIVTRRCGARSRAARTSAPTFPRATTSGSWRTRWSTATPTARPASSTCRSRSPAGRRPSGFTGRRHRMADRITLQVARYRPEQESEPTFDEYEVPCPKDWVVLDGLNHVKDQLDGTLSYRWSCRMGICGSCGMTVNGEPKLTCATFLTDYAPGPGARRAAAQLPGHPRPRRRHRRLHAEAGARSSRGSCAQAEKPLAEGEYLQTPDELDEYKQFSMCINCMLCYAACPIYGLDPKFIGPAAIALAQRYNLDSRDEGAAERLEVLSEHEGIWGCTFVGECTKVCPKNVDPAGAIQRYKLTAALESMKSFFMPRGA